MCDPRHRCLLLTDIDDSLYSPRVCAAELRRLHLLCASECDIVYLTGRTYDETVALVAAGRIPQPRLAFCDLGVTLMRGPEMRDNPLIRSSISADDHRLIRAAASGCTSLAGR